MHSSNEGSARYTLRDRGRELVVEAWGENGRQHARLLVDGEVVEEGAVGVLEDAKLGLGEVEEGGRTVQQQVLVGFWWNGRVRECTLRDTREGEEDLPKRTLKTPFAPPEGTRARRRHELREKHPNLYAMRHLALEGIAIAVGLLGIGALLSAFFGRLLPNIDWSWLPDLPEWEPPDWLRYLSPAHWIRQLWPDDWRLPDLDLPDLPDWELGWLKFVIPLLIALGAGLREIRRQRRRREREQGFDRTGTDTDEEPDGPAGEGADRGTAASEELDGVGAVRGPGAGAAGNVRRERNTGDVPEGASGRSRVDRDGRDDG